MSSITVAAPKSQQVATAIRQRIEEGDLQPGDRLLTVRQFAAEFGVSNQVVQRAFATLSEDGLIEGQVGRGTFVTAPVLARRAVIIGEGSQYPHNVLPVLLPAALQRLGVLSYVLTAEATFAGHSRDELRALLADRPFALVIDGFSTHDPAVVTWRHPRTRLVVVKRCEHDFGPDAFRALTDYQQIGYLACRHLLERGRRRIAMVVFERRPGWTSDLMARGYERALAEAGMAPCRYIADRRDHDYTAGMTAGEIPDGFVCHQDYAGVGVIESAGRLGLTAGDDYDLVGHGNTPWAAAYRFATVDAGDRQLVDVVVEHLDGPPTPGTVLITPHLVAAPPRP